jgi:hypothetical protein
MKKKKRIHLALEGCRGSSEAVSYSLDNVYYQDWPANSPHRK